MRQSRHSRRGLATVVTGAIMLSAVAFMGTGVISWSNVNLFTHQKALESTYSSGINKISEDIMIENVWFGKSPEFSQKFLNITMTNLGSIGVNITKIELINSTAHAEYKIQNAAVFPKKTFSIQIPNEWGNNALIDIIITTNRDSIFRTQALPA